MYEIYTSSLYVYKYIKVLSPICWKINYFIMFSIELHELKFHICTWNLQVLVSEWVKWVDRVNYFKKYRLACRKPCLSTLLELISIIKFLLSLISTKSLTSIGTRRTTRRTKQLEFPPLALNGTSPKQEKWHHIWKEFSRNLSSCSI
jgi:hypothetical protein